MKGNAAYSMPGRRQKLSLLYELEKMPPTQQTPASAAQQLE